MAVTPKVHEILSAQLVLESCFAASQVVDLLYFNKATFRYFYFRGPQQCEHQRAESQLAVT